MVWILWTAFAWLKTGTGDERSRSTKFGNFLSR
jgi:hypothetical protein